ncbi:MAG: DNA methyltransferase [Planctomycetota bacterium]
MTPKTTRSRKAKKSARHSRPKSPRVQYLHNPFEFRVAEEEPSYGKPGLEPIFEDHKFKVKLFKGDTLEILPKVPSETVDVIFADPPYFLSSGGITCHAGKMVSVNKGKWDEPKSVEENHRFNLNWLEQCQRLLKKNGTIWVSGTSHIIHSIGFAMQVLGFKILNDIIWYKTNAPPNLSCRYFTHSTETVLWAAKNRKSRHTFHYKEMKDENGGKQMRNVWEITASGKNEKRFGKHPTQKPVALLDRILRASSITGDLVLDPFCGSGTTGVTAIGLGRRFVGIENEDDYCDLSIRRVNGAIKQREENLFAEIADGKR